jgi:hypothetical protein
MSLADSKYVPPKMMSSSPFKAAVKPGLKVSIDPSDNELTPALNTALITSPIYYIISMPVPDTLGAPHFNGRNITEFLEYLENLFKEYYIETDIIKCRKLPRYCGKQIGRYI